MQHDRDKVTGNGGWVTTRQAARALGVIPRQVRNYIAAGDLEGRKEGKGVTERWLVSITSVESLRQKRHSEGKPPGQYRNVAENLEEAGQGTRETAALVWELAARLEDVQYELGRAEARLELTAQAESTLQEALERERERAERLEADREQLLPDLLREKDRANAERERAEHFEAQFREALEARRGWFRRFFGF